MRTTRKIILAQIILAFLMMSACTGSRKGEKKEIGIDFQKSETLSAILDLAKEKEKLVFVDFHADWCTMCRAMEAEVFTDPALAKYINENFINYKVNSEKGSGPNLVFLYKIRALPSLLFLDTRGRVLFSTEGYMSAHTLLDMAKGLKDKKSS